jgi:hypothetical protein
MNNREKDQSLTKFEFILTLGGNIVCQRFFNVKNYNPMAMNSLDIYEYVKNISDDISHDLKIKTSDYLCENQNYFLNLENVEEDTSEVKENFLLEIKLDDHVFISRIFPAYFYHPKVRYTVDIRPMLKRILSTLTDILSSKELETTYMDYDLSKTYLNYEL